MKDLEMVINGIKKFCLAQQNVESSDYTQGIVRGLEMAIEIIEENKERKENE